MSSRNLEFLFRPRSVAVVGASDRTGSVGAQVIRNALGGGFAGPIWPVNVGRDTVAGRPAWRTVADLPDVPDLAVVCTPPPTVPDVVAALAARGARAAVVLTAGLDDARTPDGRTLRAAMLDAARPALLRILGHNSVGLLAPRVGLNASFAHANALPGDLAFVSQSGALTTALLDWARGQQIGFSCFVSLGNSADVDFGDLLDYLATDPHTRAILLYIESISAARKFMSAARAAARVKPVIAVKAGRAPAAAQAARSHTGALAGADDVHDAAFRRAGMLRVTTTRELFDAAETLARVRPFDGDRLCIVGNGGGPGVMATDALAAGGGRLAALAPETIAALDDVLPPTWSHGNPVDLVGDATVERHTAALQILARDSNVDALLFLHAPTAVVSAAAVAGACAPLLARSRRAFVCLMGDAAVRAADTIFTTAGLPTYATPEEAVGAFLRLVEYRRNQALLLETPPSLPEAFVPDAAAARAVVRQALAERRAWLTEPEAKDVLAAYGIPVVATRVVRDADALAPAAEALGYPVALKILSPDLTHKSEVGGVALDLATPDALVAAARAMLERCRTRAPGARIEGFTVQRMAVRAGAIELIAGLATDPTFGPVVLFGQGGTAVEVIGDRAVALPPLNLALARELVARTRVAKLLAGYRDQPPVMPDAVELTLVQLSQLAADVAEIVELDVNPLLASAHGVVALDARIRVSREARGGAERFAVRPYPKELEETIGLEGRRVLLRPIRPEDLPAHEAFVARLSPEDLRTRFLSAVRGLSRGALARFTQIDYEREMAFIATAPDAAGAPETLGVARAHADPDNATAEFAIVVRSDLKGRGLGRALLAKLVRYCRARGTGELHGDVLATNTAMLRLASACGFRQRSVSDGTVRVVLDLRDEPPAPAS